MLRRLAVNTAITATTFLVTGLVPLLLVPVLLGRYGVAEYGLLVLVRVFLPTGALAFLDPGQSEIASFSVAKARHDGDWERCGRYLTGLLIASIAIGLPSAALMCFCAPQLSLLFNVGADADAGFRAVIYATAFVFPFLLASLIAEGVLKGMEDFKRLRLIEIGATFAYAAMAIACVSAGLPFHWVAIAYLGYGLIRGALIVWQAWKLVQRQAPTIGMPTGLEWHDIRGRSVPLGVNRVMGVAQGYAATLLIGALVGSAAVGLYDLVTRIPRLLKVVTGILNSAVLPTVMRLDEAHDMTGIRRVFDLGLLGVVCVVAPLVAWGITFSESILRFWVSQEYSHLWRWQALMFIWPLTNAITSFTCGGLLGRPRFVTVLNWIVFGQIVGQLMFSFALMPIWKEQAFVAAQVIVVCATLPFQVGLVARECGMRLRDFYRHLLSISLFAGLVAVALNLDTASLVHGPVGLVLTLVGWGCLSVAIVFGLVLTHEERQQLVGLLLRRRSAR